MCEFILYDFSPLSIFVLIRAELYLKNNYSLVQKSNKGSILCSLPEYVLEKKILHIKFHYYNM